MYRLLVVDDEVETRNALCHYFPWEEIGFEIAGQAGNGKEALDLVIRNACYDVVLADIRMPVMSGLDLAKELHSLRHPVKVILLSGYREFEYAQSAMAYGVRNYIVKPAKYKNLTEIFNLLREELDRERAGPSVRDSSLSLEEGSGQGYNYNAKIVETAKTYIRNQLKELSLEAVAEVVHMNPNYFSQFFKQKTGQTFTEYVVQAKMEKAAELLQDIRYRTYEVSEMVGYSNPKNFTRTFREYYGMTPSQFRNR
jgi:Response regulator containing CheY-like receiver domain and AraC-type DNA-binding domain